MNYILLLLGFVLLVKGADYFVDGASNIARTLKVPSLIIGLTIVAFGTSAPEAAVSITASIDGQNGMAMGNVIGSNIFNLLMVVGMAGFIKTLKVEKSIIFKEFPFLLFSSVLMFILASDMFFKGTTDNIISRSDSIVLLILFCIFTYSLLHTALSSRNKYLSEEASIAEDSLHYEYSGDTLSEIQSNNLSLTKSVIMSIVGIVSIVLGGQIVVKCASAIASNFGVSDQLIGLTIVAIGTSLPEFVTSIIAASKGESAIALGNVIGSNMFNILFIIGLSAFISPMSIDPTLFIDAIFMIFATLITFFFAARKRDVTKFESISLITIYIVYMIYLIICA